MKKPAEAGFFFACVRLYPMAACITMHMIFDKNGGKQQQCGGEKRIARKTQCSRRSSRNQQETATKRQAVRSANSTARPHPRHSRFERFHYASRFALASCRNRCMQRLHPPRHSCLALGTKNPFANLPTWLTVLFTGESIAFPNKKAARCR